MKDHEFYAGDHAYVPADHPCHDCGATRSEHPMSDLNQHEPDPTPASGDVWNLVISDMQGRRQYGFDKYGTPLQVDNGRNHLIDAYQEVLDLAVYLRAEIAKREGVDAKLAELAEIKAKGYGGLHADELAQAGHKPWMHFVDASECWCRRLGNYR